MICKTKEEAIEMKRRINVNFDPKWWCPLINAPCRKDCVCMKSAYFIYTDEREYIVKNPYCKLYQS